MTDNPLQAVGAGAASVPAKTVAAAAQVVKTGVDTIVKLATGTLDAADKGFDSATDAIVAEAQTITDQVERLLHLTNPSA